MKILLQYHKYIFGHLKKNLRIISLAPGIRPTIFQAAGCMSSKLLWAEKGVAKLPMCFKLSNETPN